MHEIGYSTNKEYNDRCEACVDILGQTQAGPSIFKILTNDNKKKIEVHDVLDTLHNESLSNRYRISYTFEGNSLINRFANNLDNNIEQKEISNLFELENAFKLVKYTFEQNYPTRLDLIEFQKGENLIRNLYQSNMLIGRNYYREDNHVGTLIFSHLHHPILSDDVLHVLFFGYDNSSLNKDHSANIKNLALNLLISNQNNRRITARIDGFNEKSIRFFKSIGMKPTYLTLDPKSKK